MVVLAHYGASDALPSPLAELTGAAAGERTARDGGSPPPPSPEAEEGPSGGDPSSHNTPNVGAGAGSGADAGAGQGAEGADVADAENSDAELAEVEAAAAEMLRDELPDQWLEVTTAVRFMVEDGLLTFHRGEV